MLLSKLTSCMLTFLDLNEINVSEIPPINPVNNQLWLCTEAYKDPNTGIEYASNTLYKWNAAAGRWEVTNDYDGDIQEILDKINQSQSRNLLLDTANSLDVESDGTTFSYGAKYFLISSIKFNDHLKNNTVTLAFDWEYIGSSPSGTLQAKTDGITPILLSDVITVSNSNYYGTSVFSYTFDEDSNKMFNAVGFNVRTNGKIRITHPRLFYGSIDYGWVQAPEDLINQFKTLFERTDKGVYIEASSTLGGKSIVDINNKAIKIASSNIVLEGYTTINQHFKVLPNGDVEAVNAKFSGDVDAFSITGATITGSKITTGENFVVGTDGILHAKHADIQGDITAGSTITGATYTSTNGKFKVLENGTMECKDANIKGSITAGSTITGAEIIGSTIRNENSTFMVKTDGTIIGANIKGGTIGIGNGTNYDAFTVDENGNVNISKGTINIANKFVVNATGKVTANDINVTGGEINMNNGVFKVTNDGTAVAQNIKITGGSLTIGSNFSVDNTGVLTATNGNFTGEIKAGSNISGASFTSNNGTLKIDANGNITSKGNVSFANGNFTCDNAGNVKLKGSLTAGTTITGASISGGSISIGNDKFTVDKNGVLTAKGATITGNITMTGGSVPDNVLSDTIKKGAANGTSALEQITNLKIGGRNLLLNTKNFDKNWSNGSVVNGTQGYKAYKLERTNYTGSGRKIAQQNINRIYSKFIKGTSITISGWIYIDSSVNIANDSNNMFVRLYNSSSGYKDYCQIQLNSLNKDTWIRFEKSEVIQADAISNGGNIFAVAIKQNGLFKLSMPKLEIGNKASDYTEAPEDTETLLDDALQNMANDLQTQIDGKIQTYNQTSDPASNWTSTEKTLHTGDIWYNGSYTYRYSGSEWVKLTDKDATNANSLASKKAQVFTTQPTIPYYKGDLWITSLNKTGVVKTCQATRTSGSYTASDWVEGLKYTDDTAVNNLSIGGRNLVTNAAPSNLNDWSNSTNWNTSLVDCSTAPSGKAVRATATASAGGGLHKAPINHTKCVNGEKYTISAWIRASKSLTIKFKNEMMTSDNNITVTTNWKYFTFTSKIDTGATYHSNIFYCQNTSQVASGTWFEVHSLKFERGSKASDWSPAPEDTDQAIIDKINAQTQQFIFNKLTNNGALEGLFMKDNKLYINGSYIQAGTVKGKYIDAKNLNVANKFSIDANGNVLIGANKTGAHIYWDGSKLEIIANSMKIGSTNVATISDVDGIQIGGRNLVKQSKLLSDLSIGAWSVSSTGSEGFKKLYINSTSTNWDECYIPIYPAINSLTNKLTISFEYKESTSGLLVFNFGVFNNNARLKELTNWVVSTTFTKHSTRDGWNYVSYTFDPTALNGITNANNYKLQFKKLNSKTGEIQVKKPMLEIGTKPSDWYPAPEDFDKAMSDKINAQTQEFIFNKLTNNGTEQGIYLNNKKIYINGSYIQAGTVKGNYIDAKNLNVANKFSIDANGNVLIGANRTGSHIYWNGTNLEVQATSIKLGTANVATITDVNSVTTRVTKLEGAGASNMIKNSDFRNGSLHWSYNKDTDWIDSNYLTPYGNTSYTVNKSGYTNDSWNGINQTISGLQNGIEYTFGCYYKAHSNYFSDDGSQIGFEIKGPKTDGSGDAVVHGATLNYSNITFNTWKWVQFSFSIPSDIDASRCYLFCWIKKNGRLTLGDFMLSKGSTITTWSLSPYDNSDYAESKITQTSDALTLEFKTHNGTPNLCPNSNPTRYNCAGWSFENTELYWGDGFKNDMAFGSCSSTEGYIWSPEFSVNANTSYSISFWALVENNVTDGFDFYIYEKDIKKYTCPIWHWTERGVWKKFKINHVTGDNSNHMQLRFDNNGDGSGSKTSFLVVIRDVMVCEGWDYFPNKWYPAQSEIYSNTVTFDRSGMEIKQSNGAHGKYDARGLRFYNTSGIKYSEISNGAFYCIDDAGNVKGYLGRSVWGNTSNYMTSVNAIYTNTVVLGVQESSNGNNISYVTCSHNDQAVGRWLDGHYQWNGVNINRNLTLNQSLIRITRNTNFDDNYPHVIGNSGDGYLSINGDNGVYLGILAGDKAYAGMQITETGTAGDNYNVVNFRCPVHMNGWSIKNIDAATDDLQPQSLAMVSALNNDSDIHNTNNTDYQIYRTDSFTVGTIKYTDRKTYKTSEEIHYNFSPPLKTGKYTCYVELPWLLAENIEQDIHISISKLSWGDYRIIDKCPYYFILESENDNFNFTYEVTAKLLEKSNGNNIVVANEQYYKYSIEGSEDKEGLVIHEGEELTKAQILSNKKQSN